MIKLFTEASNRVLQIITKKQKGYHDVPRTSWAKIFNITGEAS